jgi:hypothetical protein
MDIRGFEVFMGQPAEDLNETSKAIERETRKEKSRMPIILRSRKKKKEKPQKKQ